MQLDILSYWDQISMMEWWSRCFLNGSCQTKSSWIYCEHGSLKMSASVLGGFCPWGYDAFNEGAPQSLHILSPGLSQSNPFTAFRNYPFILWCSQLQHDKKFQQPSCFVTEGCAAILWLNRVSNHLLKCLCMMYIGIIFELIWDHQFFQHTGNWLYSYHQLICVIA